MKRKSRICPCGCGHTLGRYRGRQLLVCSSTWRVVPYEVQRDLMSTGAPQGVVLRAVREVLTICSNIRKARNA